MSRINTLHMHDVEALRISKADSNPTGRNAAIITAVVVILLGGALFMLMSSSPPQTVPGEPAAGSAPIAPAGANPPLVPEEVGSAGATTEIATVAVPAGTKLSLEIAEPISSADAVVGKEIVAKLATPLLVDGKVAVEAGAKVVGRVTETLELSEKNGNGVFGVAFDRIDVNGQSTPIAAELSGQKLELAPGRLLEIELSQAIEIPGASAPSAASATEPTAAPATEPTG